MIKMDSVAKCIRGFRFLYGEAIPRAKRSTQVYPGYGLGCVMGLKS